MNKRLKAEVVTAALAMALYKRKFPKGVIIHSDRGVSTAHINIRICWKLTKCYAV